MPDFFYGLSIYRSILIVAFYNTCASFNQRLNFPINSLE